MKLKLSLCMSAVLMMQSAFAENLQCHQDYKNIISNEMIKLGTAFNTGDLKYIEDKTDSSLINYAGGAKAYENMLEQSVSMLKKSNIKVTSVETSIPQDNYIVGNNELCFVPKQLTLALNGKQQPLTQSFMLAVRPLTSKEWKYIDGTGFKNKPELLYILFPDFPKTIKVSVLN